MSRVGKHPIAIPTGVVVNITDGRIDVSGKLGKLSLPLNDSINVSYENDMLNRTWRRKRFRRAEPPSTAAGGGNEKMHHLAFGGAELEPTA